MGKKIDITGEKFERLTAIRPVYKNGKRMWECRCDCGTVKNFTLQDLKSGRVKSCGCYNREKASKWMSQLKYKRNKYETVDDYIIGYTSNKNSPFYIDVEDYDKVKDYCWHERKDGYISSCTGGDEIFIQWIIMGERKIDHINRKRNDNRKSNLRKFETMQQNLRNKNIYKNNTSGCPGVCKSYDKWQARVIINGRSISLGVYDNLEDAIKARKEGEKKYYGDWARRDE